MKKILGIVPARAHSVRLPDKNKKKLNGKPLINYTIEAALRAGSLMDIIVSTDDRDIKKIVRKFQNRNGNIMLHERPDHLAGSEVLSEDVILSVMEFAEEAQGKAYYDYFMLLQPTSPLRSKDDIRAAAKMLSDAVGCVVSVRHDQTWNGAIYLCEWDRFKKDKRFFDPCFYYMPEDRSVDIDTEDDFKRAAAMIRKAK